MSYYMYSFLAKGGTRRIYPYLNEKDLAASVPHANGNYITYHDYEGSRVAASLGDATGTMFVYPVVSGSSEGVQQLSAGEGSLIEFYNNRVGQQINTYDLPDGRSVAVIQGAPITEDQARAMGHTVQMVSPEMLGLPQVPQAIGVPGPIPTLFVAIVIILIIAIVILDLVAGMIHSWENVAIERARQDTEQAKIHYLDHQQDLFANQAKTESEYDADIDGDGEVDIHYIKYFNGTIIALAKSAAGRASLGENTKIVQGAAYTADQLAAMIKEQLDALPPPAYDPWSAAMGYVPWVIFAVVGCVVLVIVVPPLISRLRARPATGPPREAVSG